MPSHEGRNAVLTTESGRSRAFGVLLFARPGVGAVTLALLFGLFSLQRDWARQETAEGFTQILFGGERPLAGASTEPAGDGARAGR